MEVIGVLILIGFLLFIFSGQDRSLNKLKNDADLKKWKEESISGKTSLKLDAWKNLQNKNKLIKRAEAQNTLYKELVERGRQKKNVIRHGTIRIYGDEWVNYFTESSTSNGIHPEEASLRERKEKAEEIVHRGWQRDTKDISLEHAGLISLDGDNVVKPPASKEEKLAATEELKKIDYEWCLLNNRLLDEYYLNKVSSTSRNEFVLSFRPPDKDSSFPYSAGSWHAKSKLWGVKQFNKIQPLHGSGTSKNQALFKLAELIQARKHQIVELPFDPWDVDL